MIMLRSPIKKYLKSNEDNVLNGRLNMQQHKITNLADPVDSYDAVNLRYVSSRIQALTDETVSYIVVFYVICFIA